MRQNDGAADHLVCVLRIDAETHMHFDSFIELHKMDPFQKAHRVFERIRSRASSCFFAASYFFPGFAIFNTTRPQFPCFGPCPSLFESPLPDSPHSNPAASAAQYLQPVFDVTVPTLLLFGSPEPFAMLAARFSKMEAGGVFVMKL